MFFSLFVRECDCSHKMILEKVIYRPVYAFRTVTNIDNTAALPHKFLFPDLQRARLFAGGLKLYPTVPGRIREHYKPVRSARNARPGAFAAYAAQRFNAPFKILHINRFRGHIVKNGRNTGRLH